MPQAERKQGWSLAKTGTTAALFALAALGTLLIRIPIPVTTGYFNVGDIFVVLAGLWLGPIAGLVVGMFGPTAADVIGYPQFVLATAVTKGLEGLLVGLIGYGERAPLWRKGVAASVGGLTIVVGYLVFEGFIYPAIGHAIPFFNVTNLEAAYGEVLPNLLQGAVGAAVGLGLWKAVSGYSPGKSKVPDKSKEP